MDSKFAKLESLTEINLDLIDAVTVETQLKSMKLGYVNLGFVLKDMEQEFNRLFDLNLKDYDEDTIAKAEVHALKQLENPEYYSGQVMKTVPHDVARCFQAILMLKNKKDEIEIKQSEKEIVEKNIGWLSELLTKLKRVE